jgi:fructuronate reductase
MADPAFAAFARSQMDEVTPTLIVPPGIDVEGRKAALCERFKNPALKHRTWQIAMDGSQKLPQRLLAPIRDLLKQGAPIDHVTLGVAAWMRYVTGIDEKGAPIDVRDPLAVKFRAIADKAGPNAERLAPALIGVEEVFGSDLPHDPRFVEAVTRALAQLYERGGKRAVAEGVAGG